MPGCAPTTPAGACACTALPTSNSAPPTAAATCVLRSFIEPPILFVDSLVKPGAGNPPGRDEYTEKWEECPATLGSCCFFASGPTLLLQCKNGSALACPR